MEHNLRILQALPDLPLDKILKMLNFCDLKNLRLTSTGMNQRVLCLDPRFRVWKIRFMNTFSKETDLPDTLPFFRSSHFDVEVTIPTKFPNWRLCQFLQSCLPRITAIKVVSQKLGTNYHIIRRMTSLKKIEVWGWNPKYLSLLEECSYKLQYLDISASNPCRVAITAAFPVLKVLKLSDTLNTVQFLNNVLSSSPSLEVLEISNAKLMNMNPVKLKRLKSLTLINCIDTEGFATLFEACKESLEVITLKKLDFLNVSFPSFPRLKSINMHISVQIQVSSS